MNAGNPAALDALRDIHLPEAVGLWPVAPGWWVIAGLLVAGWVAFILYRRARARRARSWQAETRREIDRLATEFERSRDATVLAIGLSALLRRVALARQDRGEVASLHGDAWLAYWLADAAEDPSAGRRALQELTRISYRGAAGCDPDPEAWIAFVHRSVDNAAKETP